MGQELRPITSIYLPRMKWEYEEDRTGIDDLLCFGTADMDYASPQPILNAIQNVVDHGHLGYPQVSNSYYDAIHNWLIRKAGWNVDAPVCVRNNVGIYMSAWNFINVLTSPGDKIAILTPVHFCFKRMINLNNRITIECPLHNNNGHYEIDYMMLESCLASGSKMLWICNPHNPVGRAWTREELQRIAELCSKYNVLIMSDDVYCDLLFSGTEYTPIASLSKEISYRTVTLYSTSKSYNTTGLRHSFVVVENPEFMKKYEESLECCDLEYGMNIMGLAATISAFNECQDWSENLMAQIQKNHEMVWDFFNQNMMPGLVAKADSTYFGWIDLRSLNVNPKQLAFLIEQEEHMIVGNGSDLGKGGDGYIRMNLATSEENLKSALQRLLHFWNNHTR